MTSYATLEKNAPHLYSIFGLSVASELDLPEAVPIMPPLAAASPPDVYVEAGPVPLTLPGGSEPAPWLSIRGTTWLMRIPDIGRFLVENGRQIVVEKEHSVCDADMRVFLLGSALGALAHQRGLMPLHVSAVATPAGAIAFTGVSGAGKSTIAAQLNRRHRWPLICDDTAVVFDAGAQPYLRSGINTVRLWQDALQTLNLSSEGLKRDLTRFDKFHAIDSDRFTDSAIPIKQLVFLEWGEELKLKQVAGRHAYMIVMSAIYRPDFAPFCSNVAALTQTGLAVAAKIDVAILTRPKDPAFQRDVLDLIACEMARK